MIADALMLKSLIFRLIYTVIKDSRAVGAQYGNRSGGGAVEAAIKYIKENLTERLALRTIAERVGFSEVHFHNIFKTAVGKTLHEL